MIADTGFWHDVNDLHTPFLFLSVARPLLQRRGGVRDSARVGEGLVLTYVATRALKGIVREERPGGGTHDSFPSGHASTSFLAASMNAALFPREAPYWYAGATLLSIARNEIGVHYFGDVVAGAALGYGIGRGLVGRPNGLVIAPLFTERGTGAQLTMRF